MGWGGKRTGAGAKPKPAGQSAHVLEHPSVPPTTNGPPEIEEFDAPDSLLKEEREVWLKQAPHAFKNGTLHYATALSFERYCRIVVLERKEAESSARGGGNHRGLLKQINAYELQFLLTPCGKPIAVPKSRPAEPESKLARFRKAVSA